MKQYLDLCNRIISEGTWIENKRTGKKCLTVINADLTYDVASGEFPLVTTRKSFYKSAIAEILGITDILKKPVGGLSGGDRQRVALGRAIVRDPKAFFMDEPLGALDAEFREHMSEELRALHDRMGATTVYVTHDQLEAM